MITQSWFVIVMIIVVGEGEVCQRSNEKNCLHLTESLEKTVMKTILNLLKLMI